MAERVHIFSFLCVYFKTNLLSSVNWNLCLLYGMYMTRNRFTLLAQTRSSCVPFNFSGAWFCWTVLMAYSKAMLKRNCFMMVNIVTCYGVTTDWFWIGDRIYLTICCRD
jgi:hypothetical protein